MKERIFELNNIRTEISFKSFNELRFILSFHNKNNLYKINIPCKNNLKKDFLIDSIKIAREEFPNINIIPHFSIFHEFNKNKINTLNSFIKFIEIIKSLDCEEVLLVSGSQKRSTLNTVSTLSYLMDKNFFSDINPFIGVAFNPYLPSVLFEQEIINLDQKIKSGIVKSIWFQFGTDFTLLESRIERLKNIIYSAEKVNSKKLNIIFFGSILIPSKQFLNRFKFRPWKGVYCSQRFLDSIDFANDLVVELLKIYNKYNIFPLIETDISNESKLNALKKILEL